VSSAGPPAPVGVENPAFATGGVFLSEERMDREEGFPPHVIGFMKRKREKEGLDDPKPLKAVPLGDDQGRSRSTA
jgi:hypothetical protein